MSEQFQGFDYPNENWSKLPHIFIDMMPHMSGSELKVMLYILRHTWGYQEYGEKNKRKITMDEFMHGRKRKDRTRMDGGTGLSENGVKSGLRAAIDHGYLEIEEDLRDLARLKRSYWIKMYDCTASKIDAHTSKNDVWASKNDVWASKNDPITSKNDPRTGKDTNLKIPRANALLPANAGNNVSSCRWGIKAANLLHKALIKNRKVMRRINTDAWAKTFAKYFKANWEDRETIRRIFNWYCDNMHLKYVPIAASPNTFIKKLPDIEQAMLANGYVDGPIDGAALLAEQVSHNWTKHHDMHEPYIQDNINIVLVALGQRPNAISENDMLQLSKS